MHGPCTTHGRTTCTSLAPAALSLDGWLENGKRKTVVWNGSCEGSPFDIPFRTRSHRRRSHHISSPVSPRLRMHRTSNASQRTDPDFSPAMNLFQLRHTEVSDRWLRLILNALNDTCTNTAHHGNPGRNASGPSSNGHKGTLPDD